MSENVENNQNNVNLIRGDYKVALRTIATPLIFTLMLNAFYNLIDRVWVAGLGADPLAAIGFISPFFIIIGGIGNGFGAGANSLISRFIGAKDKKNANNSAWHGIILGVIVSILIPIIILPFLEEILTLMGASSVMGYATEYADIIIIGSFAIVFNGIFSSQLRAEGDIKRSTIALITSGILNIILDPIFIYVLDLGVQGAALATILSATIATLVMLYWILIKKDTYVDLSLDQFTPSKSITNQLLTVAIPGSVEQIVISVVNMIMNAILAMVASTTVVAAFTTAFSVINLCMMVSVGIGTAAITVAGVAYGSNNYTKVKDVYHYAAKLSLILGIILCVLLLIFSPYVAMLFSYTSSSAGLSELISDVLRILSFFIIAISVGVCASNVFQAMGKGLISLVLTVLRELIFVVLFNVIFVFVFGLGAHGVYLGFVAGIAVGTIISHITIEGYFKRIIKYTK
ncbi:MAG: MATE family efflux transporter [Methanosphaera sp.]|nr:MATE family efflux transporter [Methanosphaera sp.]